MGQHETLEQIADRVAPNGGRKGRMKAAKARAAHKARMAAAYAEAAAIIITGRCPRCGAGIHRNLSLTNWWQCDRSGAPGFRRDPEGPSCSWQTFTEA